jgi:hypothetical protein
VICVGATVSQTVVRSVLGTVGALCLLPGCGASDDPVTRAIDRSKEALEIAKRQGHDIKRAPCIYYPNDDPESWFAFVVFPGDGPPRKAALKCPGGKTLGYVALSPSGEVIEVTRIPADWKEFRL